MDQQVAPTLPDGLIPVVTSGENPLDDPRQWGQVIPAPVDINVKQFQTHLNRIAGRNASGKPVMRLIWGWSEEARDWRAGDWRMRYRFHTVHLPLQKLDIDLAVPRWFLEELLEPAQYLDQWNLHRYQTAPDGTELVDVLGPPPDGWYQHALTIADHDKNGKCCDLLWKANRRTCWGLYRPPGDRELSMVSKAVLLRDAEPMLNRPDEPMSPKVFAICAQAQFEAKAAREKRINDQIGLIVDDAIRSHAFSWTSTDPGVHQHGRYHFLKNPSGLFVHQTKESSE